MADRFDTFTEQARLVLTRAQEEAQRLNHDHVGTEHLLLGLLLVSDSAGEQVLVSLGVELDRIRSAVEFIIGRGERAVLAQAGLTPHSRRVIELAVDEARHLNQNYVGSEHLLAGMVREGEGIAAGVLESVGVNLDRVRAATHILLRQEPSQRAASADRARIIHATGRDHLTRLIKKWFVPPPDHQLIARLVDVHAQVRAAELERQEEFAVQLGTREQALWAELRRLNDDWRTRWQTALARINALAQSRGIEPVVMLEHLADLAEQAPEE